MMEAKKIIPRLEGLKEEREERRHGGRLPCEMVRCQFGKLADLSGTGARVVTRSPRRLRVGQPVLLKMRWCAGVTQLPAKTARVLRRRSMRWEVGFEFDSLDAEQREALGMLMKTAAARCVIGPGIENRSAI